MIGLVLKAKVKAGFHQTIFLLGKNLLLTKFRQFRQLLGRYCGTYCPGKMTEYPKSKSTEGFYQVEWSPCSSYAALNFAPASGQRKHVSSSAVGRGMTLHERSIHRGMSKNTPVSRILDKRNIIYEKGIRAILTTIITVYVVRSSAAEVFRIFFLRLLPSNSCSSLHWRNGGSLNVLGCMFFIM